MKKTYAFRLSDDGGKLIKSLAKRKGISQSAVIELAIREMQRKELEVNRKAKTRGNKK